MPLAGLTDTLLGLASPWGYVVFGLLAMLEGAALLGLLAPGEAGVLVAGVLAGRGRLDLPTLLVLIPIAAFVGDNVGFLIGRRFGDRVERSRLLQSRLGQRLVGDGRLDRARDVMARRGAIAVIAGRFVGFLRPLIPVVAGISPMRWAAFARAS